MRATPITLALAALFLATPLSAKDFVIPGDLCDRLAFDTAEPLAGDWTAVNREGGGTVGSKAIGLSGKDKESVDFEYAGNGVLVMRGINDQGPQRMELQPQTVAEHLPTDFRVQIDGRIREIDVAAMLPCEWEKMPGYVGNIEYDLNGMGTMNMKVIANFPSVTHGFGLLHFTGDMMGRRIDVLRYFSLTRD
ncbi:hypothetical protein P7228_13680 [Altererythrobacter arenosus]|uniref:NADH:ubiquinone oxidoreductase intermediate-associated protein 30 domain-containing protein n=1 Tax=Altererythrobacter arenosus TaxID=3032592 RepID=A0ABY8FSZ2_9SPHN|nr:hypothetical protein [Altererythrobacter sp. CAU 1644]WFL77028.1 hypothetical protein P7228_13680 [Altererythrobacter sp. CAU 1644]